MQYARWLATWIALLHMGVSPTHADPIVETNIDHNGRSLYGVYIIVQPPQPTLMGTSPDFPLTPAPGRYNGIHHVPASLIPGADFAATAIQAALVLAEKRRYERTDEEDDQFSYYVDFSQPNALLLRDIDASSDWETTHLDYYSFYNWETHRTNLDGPVNRILQSRGVDAVIALRATYYMSPTLNQVRILVQSRVAAKNRSLSIRDFDRNYEFLSVANRVALRPWHDGERESRIQSIERAFESSVADNPTNRHLYEKERASAIEFLETSDTIPAGQAFRECWTTEKLQQAFEQGAMVLNEAIRRDLNELLDSNYPRSKSRKIAHYNHDGNPNSFRANPIGQIDGFVVYRRRDKDIFVLPRE